MKHCILLAFACDVKTDAAVRGKLADINLKLSVLEKVVDRLEVQIKDAVMNDEALERSTEFPLTDSQS